MHIFMNVVMSTYHKDKSWWDCSCISIIIVNTRWFNWLVWMYVSINIWTVGGCGAGATIIYNGQGTVSDFVKVALNEAFPISGVFAEPGGIPRGARRNTREIATVLREQVIIALTASRTWMMHEYKSLRWARRPGLSIADQRSSHWNQYPVSASW